MLDSLKPEDTACGVTHHVALGALKQSAAGCCCLCKLFHHEIEQSRGTRSKYLQSRSIEDRLQAVDVQGRAKVHVQYCDAGVGQHQYHLASTTNKLNRLLTPCSDLELCLQWLRTCCRPPQAVHGNCPALLHVKLHSRVLEVGTLPDDPIRLVEIRGAKGTHACLSHCWAALQCQRGRYSPTLNGIYRVSLSSTCRDRLEVRSWYVAR